MGLIQGLYLALFIFGPPFHWHGVLLSMLGLMPLVLVALAWKWAGRWGEVVGGAGFIALGMGGLLLILIRRYPWITFYRDDLLVIGWPVLTGILFLLAYIMRPRHSGQVQIK